MNQKERVQNIGESILASVNELYRMACPKCGHSGLDFAVNNNVILVHCEIPLRKNEETGEFETCDFSHLVYPTDVTKGPFALKFSDTDPRSVKKPATRKAPTRRTRR